MDSFALTLQNDTACSLLLIFKAHRQHCLGICLSTKPPEEVSTQVRVAFMFMQIISKFQYN